MPTTEGSTHQASEAMRNCQCPLCGIRYQSPGPSPEQTTTTPVTIRSDGETRTLARCTACLISEMCKRAK